MINPRNLRLALGLTFISSCLLFAVEDPNLQQPVLQFEESKEELVLDARVAEVAKAGDQKIAYAADIVRKPGTTFNDWGATGTPSFEDYVPTKEFSDGQKQLLAVRYRLGDRYTSVLRMALGRDVKPTERTRLLLYAVSLEDARKMAQAYIDCAIHVYTAQRKGYQDYRLRVLWNAASARKRIAEIDEAFKTGPSDFESFVKSVPYSSDREATDAIAELDKTLNGIAVEVAGIKARLEAIQASAGRPDLEGLRGNLGRMFEMESIDLQGAETRKRMATDLRNQAKRFVDLTKGPDEKTKLLDEVMKWEQTSLELERILATEKPPEIVDNKVFIYRVRQAE